MIKTVFLDYNYVERAKYLADKKYHAWIDKMGKKKAGEHYPNTPQGHLVGMLGQFAAHMYFDYIGQKPVANFLGDKESLPDILLEASGTKVEVKCWNNRWFYKWGRAINIDQYKYFLEKDIVVWTSVDIDDYLQLNGVWAYIKGYNSTKEFDVNKKYIEVWNEKAQKMLKSWQVDNSVMVDMKRLM